MLDFRMCNIIKFTHNRLVLFTAILCVYQRWKFKTVELLKRAIITEWQKYQMFHWHCSFNKWCRGLACVAKNDWGHVEHSNLAWKTAFIKHYCYTRLFMGYLHQ